MGDGGFDRLGGELWVTPRAAVDVYVVSRETGLRVGVREGGGRSPRSFEVSDVLGR